MAQQLSQALESKDKQMAWALIDSGGPYWVKLYDDFQALGGDRERAIENLEELSVVAARAILDRARKDRWIRVLSEAIDPFAMISARTEDQRKRANLRIDLLVDRGQRSPLIVDLKTGERPDVDDEVAGVTAKYSPLVTAAVSGPVRFQVLGLSFDGEVEWSDTIPALR